MSNIRLLMTGAAAMILSSCVNDTIYDTAHPSHGQITLTTDWTDRGTDVAIPASYIVRVGEYSATLTGVTHTIDNLFLPGTYHAILYNTAEKITVSGTTVAVATVTAPTGAPGTFIDPLPGWLFTWAGDQTIEKDHDYILTAAMAQQVRELNLIVTPTGGTVERISGITATLSGVASTLDIDSRQTGGAANVAPVFTKIATGADAGKYKATVRLLGITGSAQTITLTLSFANGFPANSTQTYELSTLLSAFNADKKTPLTLGSQIVETPTGAGFTATITDWTVVTDHIDVH